MSCIQEVRPEDLPGASVWTVERPPSRLRVRGDVSLLSALKARGLSVVGTRAPTARAEVSTRQWIRELRGSGLIIASGLAPGIDSTSHEAALSAGLPTVAFLAPPLDQTLPPLREDLKNRIVAAGGLLVSEHPHDGSPVEGWRFSARNRFLGGAARAVLVIEAGARSGTFGTATQAFRHQTPCYVVPAWPGDPRTAGNDALLEWRNNEAAVFPFTGPWSLRNEWHQLRALLPGQPRRPPKPRTPLPGTPEEVELWIRDGTLLSGGIPLPSLIDRATAAGWAPGPLFKLIEDGVRSGRFVSREGRLASGPVA
ncbi:MAG TPA: DNA-processing protein DprA [Bdellovibrionota bacterium]|jgi:DNA protecting protein DprA|nr:DNA-processing protein DprA [Bdellovibrionota bacterium]